MSEDRSYGFQSDAISELLMKPERLDKYWGHVATLRLPGFIMKRICMRAGCQSSLEFHVRKTEVYWVESGRLRVGLRVGRGENRSVVLSAGEGMRIPPGLMHMRIAETDVVLYEASDMDDDADSHLVEDGQTYRHVERAERETGS